MCGCVLQVEKEELEIAKIELEERVSTLQSQLNKLVEENSRLRSSTSRTPPPPSSPTTLTPIMEPSTEAEENEESPSHIYAKVDYSKVSPLSSHPHTHTHTHTSIENITSV